MKNKKNDQKLLKKRNVCCVLNTFLIISTEVPRFFVPSPFVCCIFVQKRIKTTKAKINERKKNKTRNVHEYQKVLLSELRWGQRVSLPSDQHSFYLPLFWGFLRVCLFSPRAMLFCYVYDNYSND